VNRAVLEEYHLKFGTKGSDAITADEFKKRLFELCSLSGLSGLPRKSRDRHILLKSVALLLDKTQEYSEGEINQVLQAWLTDVGRSIEIDHVELRRRLIDHEYLGRSKDGSRYWVAVWSRLQMAFEREIEEVDVPLLIKQSSQASLEKKKRYLSLQEN
tara:strand:- start:639 stop:1112 length:474 start_codon:yes stop_codon:yes gene_type:complete